jgi:hypothetical protein
MADIKTKPTNVTVDTFIDTVTDSGKREDSRRLVAMMERITGEPAAMWGPSIIGFGSYHYRYDSGHEADMCRTGFSPRANALTLYVLVGGAGQDALLGRLGKHKRGKGCLYIKTLADVDEAVLEQLIAAAWREMQARYPA